MIDDQACLAQDDPNRLSVLPQGVAERRGLLVYKLANELFVRMTPHFEELGIDGRDYALLAVLSNDAPGSQAELARLCSLLPAQLVPVLDALEQGGLVERRRDDRDRRRMIVRITDEGRARLAQADAAARTIEDELLGPLDDEAVARLGAGFRDALGAPAPAV
ncbi:MarR family winged helix-turn-helix transcriptional regulator [Patulibacter sp.]|uniref:MarR family winged helix-turn-helix transcriptional regulator n=1 Tax=Patulibacter sp. TaxID=1912859 RepID=UPI00272864B4|nr:MarR family transcriptional regulator [Patulibacter sp.]MDO9408390.1 MarR family transcriptional regulator [Patulibacter sp.]